MNDKSPYTDEQKKIIEEEGLYFEEPKDDKRRKVIILLIILVALLGVLTVYVTLSNLNNNDNPDFDLYGLNYDKDGDGICDLNCDTNNDGKADTNIDTNNDGKPDLNITFGKGNTPYFNLDRDGDGKPDFNLVDQMEDGVCKLNCTDKDGKVKLNVDFNGDGKADLNIDKDKDGKADTNLPYGDGITPIFNVEDENGNKKNRVNEWDGDSSKSNIDTDGDGRPDINITLDENKDPYLDLDTDGDGKSDVNKDFDKDGKPDADITLPGGKDPIFNVTEDGEEPVRNLTPKTVDGKDLNIDTDGDGFPDTNLDIEDKNYCQLNCDISGDLKADVNLDLDGDGLPDTNIIDTKPGSEDITEIDTNKHYFNILTFKDLVTDNKTLSPGFTASKEFVIVNSSLNDIVYTISFKDVKNNFVGNDLKYWLIDMTNNKVVTNGRVVAPKKDSKIVENITLKSKEQHRYQLYFIFEETNKNQDIDQGKTFSGKVQIENASIVN